MPERNNIIHIHASAEISLFFGAGRAPKARKEYSAWTEGEEPWPEL